MPMNLDYVFSTYGIWLVTVVLYAGILRRKLKNYNHALETLQKKKKP